MTECPVCGGDPQRDEVARSMLGLDSGHPCVVWRCASCGTRWLAPFPSPVGAELYDHSYYESPEEGHLYSVQTQQMIICYKQRARHFRALGVANGLLDVGCGTGDFLLAARDEGVLGVGVELSSYAAEIAARSGLDVWRGDLHGFPGRVGGYSAVHCSHVLEHAYDARAFLGRIHDLLEPGAPFYFEVPLQFDGILDRIKRWRGESYPYSVYSIHHHYFFTVRSFCALLHSCGFVVDSCTTYLPSRRAARPPSLRKWALQSLLWAADRVGLGGDVISVWGHRGR